MWVVARVGAKQYKVKEGDIIDVQRIQTPPSGKVTLGQVMLYSDPKGLEVGNPYLKEIKLEAKVVAQKKAKKIIVYKHKRRKDYDKKTGHRQNLTSLQILKIKTK
jgi:large subunit ribosomal protein L21